MKVVNDRGRRGSNDNPYIDLQSSYSFGLQQLRHSLQLPMALQALQTLLEAEQERRARFYDEVSEGQKAEFINGEVIVQSPAKLQHTIASQNLFILLNLYVSAHNLGYIGHEKILIALTRNDYELC